MEGLGFRVVGLGNGDWGAVGLGYRDQGVGLTVQRFTTSGYPPCGIVGHMGGLCVAMLRIM